MLSSLIKSLSNIHPYKDYTALPNVISITHKEGAIYIFIIYVISIIGFIVSFVSYTSFDSLKVKVNSITSKYEGSNCQFLVQYTGQVSDTVSHFPDDYISYVEQNYQSCYCSTDYKVCTTQPSLKFGFYYSFSYTNAFFANYEECLNIGKLTCSIPDSNKYSTLSYYGCPLSQYHGDGSPGMKPTCFYGSSQISLVLTLLRSNDPSDLNGYEMGWITEPAYTDTEHISKAISEVFSPEEICKPFLSNPPYQCTTYDQLSYLQIISQSFAIASAAVTILVTISSLILGQIKKFDSESHDTNATRKEDFEMVLKYNDTNTDTKKHEFEIDFDSDSETDTAVKLK